jgi:hypothetical protein
MPINVVYNWKAISNRWHTAGGWTFLEKVAKVGIILLKGGRAVQG